MATKKRGLLTSSPQRWQHLRAYVKRQFWRRERRASRRDAVERAYELRQSAS